MSLQNILSSTYKNRRVLVTGHTGFKGSWLTLWLHSLGAEVLGLSIDPPSSPAMYTAAGIKGLTQEAHVDINDYPLLAKTVQDFAPEVVLHLAALSLVRPSYQDPLSTLNTNIMGTANVLESCRHTDSVKAIVVVTSDKCYRNNEWVWAYRENDPMGGYDPYSASKGCAELLVSAFTNSFFPASGFGKTHHVAVASARAGNAIGGGDWGLDRLVPDCFRALHQGEVVHIRYPNAVRPWQHVLECLSGYLLLGSQLLQFGPKFNCGWNFAPMYMGDVWPVERIVKKICTLWGGGRYEISKQPQPHEANMLCLDCTKANIELGWHQHYRVAKALEITTHWYKQWSTNPDPGYMREVTLAQIEDYVRCEENKD